MSCATTQAVLDDFDQSEVIVTSDQAATDDDTKGQKTEKKRQSQMVKDEWVQRGLTRETNGWRWTIHLFDKKSFTLA